MIPVKVTKEFICSKILLQLTALAAVAMAEPEAEAGYYGYHPGFYGYYGHQLNWPLLLLAPRDCL